jgi:membrane protein implicated in regulation of membrane protease activity
MQRDADGGIASTYAVAGRLESHLASLSPGSCDGRRMMQRLLRALALGCVLWGWLVAPASATEPTVGEVARAAAAVGSPATLWYAAGSLLSAGVLVILELHLPTHGLLGLGGLVAFLLGAFLLLAPPETALPLLAMLDANRHLIATAGGLFGLLGLVAVRAGLGVRRLPVFDPLAGLAGARGIAASALSPDGTVLVRRERWSAVAEGPPVGPGEPVEIVARDGLTLRVRRIAPIRAFGPGELPSQGSVRPGVRVEGDGSWTSNRYSD